MRREHGFTLIELLIVVAIIGVIAAMAVPQLLRARLSAQEANAVASLRAVSSGEANYAASCGSGGYATELADLAKVPPHSNVAFISPDLYENGVKHAGFIFNVVKNGAAGTADVTIPSCNGATNDRATMYFASAEPIEPGVTGIMNYATDTPATIYMDQSDPVPNPIPSDATPFR